MLLTNKIKLPNTLAFRLTLWYTMSFVIVSSAAFLILYLSINSILSLEIDEDLVEDVTEFKLLYESDGLTRVYEEIIRELMSEDDSELFIRLLDSDGQPLYNSNLSEWPDLTTEPPLFQRPTENNTILATGEFSKQEYPTRMAYGLISDNIIIHIGESIEPKEEIMELLLLVISILFCVLIPIASGIGWLMARQAVLGIEEVSRAASDFEHGEFDRQVAVNAHDDEVQKLADTFNSMAERIQNLIAEMREMTDNIAHDLRSPLARIRAISEGVLSAPDNTKDCNKAAADTLEECDRLIQLINTTLDVAEAEAGVATSIQESVDLYDLTKDAFELFEPVAEQKHIDLTSTLEPVRPLRGDRHNLQRMLANLLDNALKYTPEDGSVRIHLTADEQQVQIAISDTGMGIPDSDQHRIFDRFFRCDQSRSEDGCGLGLSFARAVAHAHGGEIKVTSVPNQSSTFTISLPLPRIRA